MGSLDSKIIFLNLFELINFQHMYDKLQLYLLQSYRCKVDNVLGCFLVSFLIKLISLSFNVTALDGDDVLVVTEGEDNIYHSEISYAVLKTFVCICVY